MVSDAEFLFLQDLERKKQKDLQESLDNPEGSTLEPIPHDREIARYEGQDTDHDSLDDGMEIQVGLHDRENRPNHTLNGVKTRGKAYTDYNRGGVQFPYDNSMVNLRVRPPKGMSQKGNDRWTIPSPKKMALNVDFGNQNNHHTHEVSMGENIKSPHRHNIDPSRVKNVNISGVVSGLFASSKKINTTNSAFSRKFADQHTVKKSSEKNKSHDSVNSLVSRLNSFVQPPKSGKLNFDLSHIKSPLGKKKVEKKKSNKANDSVNSLVARLSGKSEKREENSMVDRMNDFVSLKRKRVLI